MKKLSDTRILKGLCFPRSTDHPSRSAEVGFTLLEVMISLAIVGGLLVTLIYTLNHHLAVAERQSVITTSTILAKEKMYEMEKKPVVSTGDFKERYPDFSYETSLRDSSFAGMVEISVVIRNGDEVVSLSELIRKPK